MKDKKILLAEMNPTIVTREISDFILEKIIEHNYAGGIIGLSGGVDSTVSAILAKIAIDKLNSENSERFELVGYILPSDTNHKKDTEDGIKVAEKLGIRYEVQNIEPIVEAFKTTNPEALKADYHRGNLTSRVRANVLHTKAAVENKIVIGTGNWNEDFVLNYYTLFGDGAVHISPLGNLPKRLVKQLAIYHGFSESAKREPTAGLEPNQTDFRDLGYSYDTAEIIAEGFRQGLTATRLANLKQVYTAADKDMRDYYEKFNSHKFRYAKQIITDVARRQVNSEKKSSLLHPPAPEVTLYYR